MGLWAITELPAICKQLGGVKYTKYHTGTRERSDVPLPGRAAHPRGAATKRPAPARHAGTRLNPDNNTKFPAQDRAPVLIQRWTYFTRGRFQHVLYNIDKLLFFHILLDVLNQVISSDYTWRSKKTETRGEEETGIKKETSRENKTVGKGKGTS